MRNRLTLAASLAALIHLVAPATAAPAIDVLPDSPESDVPPRGPLPFFRHGPDGTDPDALPGFPELRGPPVSGRPALGSDGTRDDPSDGAAADAKPEPPPKPPTRAETVDKLLGRLAKAEDSDEAQGIAGLVQRLWMQSGSDTADLLMARAMTAMSGNRRDVAAALLDKVIDLQPGWAEAWNKRATLRFLEDDDSGSMADISHVLALEPRHFGALSGMGFILERHGEDAAALKALRRALAVYPQNAEVRKAVDKLAPTVEGQEL